MPTKKKRSIKNLRKKSKKNSRRNSRRISKKLSRKNSRKNLRKRNSMKRSRKNKKLRGGMFCRNCGRSNRIDHEGTALKQTTSLDNRKKVCKFLKDHNIDLGDYYTVKQNDNKSYTVNSLEDNCSEEIKQSFTAEVQTMDRPKIKQAFTEVPLETMDRT